MSVVPDRMRVARLHGWGDVRVEEAPVPLPGAGEALVRIDACGVCGSDALDWYVARKAAARPVVLGHEPAGVVVALGEGVATLSVGDRVFVHHHAPCLACAECRRGLWSSCATWRGRHLEPGGFADYALASATTVAHDTLVLPDAMEMETASFIEPVACGVRAVRRHGRIERDDVVLVVGLGAMGLLIAQIARDAGARAVVGSDFLPDRRELAARIAVDIALDPRAAAVAATARELSGGRGADVVVVCPGDAAAVKAGIDAAAPGARVVCFTPLPPESPLDLDLSSLYFREITLTQSYSCGPDETREALRLLSEGRLDVAPLVTHRVGLGGVGDAILRAAGKGSVAGIKTIVFPARE